MNTFTKIKCCTDEQHWKGLINCIRQICNKYTVRAVLLSEAGVGLALDVATNLSGRPVFWALHKGAASKVRHWWLKWYLKW